MQQNPLCERGEPCGEKLHRVYKKLSCKIIKEFYSERKVLKTLEYHKIIEQLTEYAYSPMQNSAARDFAPSRTRHRSSFFSCRQRMP